MKLNRQHAYGAFVVNLFTVFLVSKLFGVIHWSWWWVTSPLWIPVCLLFGITICGIGLMYIGIAGQWAYRVTVNR